MILLKNKETIPKCSCSTLRNEGTRLWPSTFTLYQYKRSPALYKVTSTVHPQGNDSSQRLPIRILVYSLVFSEPTRDFKFERALRRSTI